MATEGARFFQILARSDLSGDPGTAEPRLQRRQKSTSERRKLRIYFPINKGLWGRNWVAFYNMIVIVGPLLLPPPT
jgi:hypothetical protein